MSCVPSFAYNLLSVSKLLKDAKCIATFAPTHCSIQAPSWKTSLKIGKQLNGLYLLSQTKLCQYQNILDAQIITYAASTAKTLLWQYQLGHVPSPVL